MELQKGLQDTGFRECSFHGDHLTEGHLRWCLPYGVSPLVPSCVQFCVNVGYLSLTAVMSVSSDLGMNFASASCTILVHSEEGIIKLSINLIVNTFLDKNGLFLR